METRPSKPRICESPLMFNNIHHNTIHGEDTSGNDHFMNVEHSLDDEFPRLGNEFVGIPASDFINQPRESPLFMWEMLNGTYYEQENCAQFTNTLPRSKSPATMFVDQPNFNVSPTKQICQPTPRQRSMASAHFREKRIKDEQQFNSIIQTSLSKRKANHEYQCRHKYKLEIPEEECKAEEPSCQVPFLASPEHKVRTRIPRLRWMLDQESGQKRIIYSRPRGRSPLLKSWDYFKGEWVPKDQLK